MPSLLSNNVILFTLSPTLSDCQIDKYFSLRRVTHQGKHFAAVNTMPSITILKIRVPSLHLPFLGLLVKLHI